MKLGRNDPCYCGSKIKYKKCHLNIDNNPLLASSGIPIDSELDRQFRESRIKECMYPKKEDCTNNIISAHSIQNNRFLNKIAENGDVVMPTLTFTKTTYKAKFSTIGRKKATTFHGFCKFHDKNIFQAIEDSSYIAKRTDEQKFLFAYRSFAYEYHTKKEAIKNHNDMKNKNQNKELYDAYGKSNDLALKDLEELLTIFNKAILENDFTVLEHQEFIINGASPLAVSGLCYLEYDVLGNLVDDIYNASDKLGSIMVNLFTEEDKTIILISWLKKHKLIYNNFKIQLAQLSQYELLKMINNMLPLYFENAVYSPKFIREWSSSEKEEFLSLFALSADSLNHYKKMQDIEQKKNLLKCRNYNLFSDLIPV